MDFINTLIDSVHIEARSPLCYEFLSFWDDPSTFGLRLCPSTYGLRVFILLGLSVQFGDQVYARPIINPRGVCPLCGHDKY